MKKLTGIIVIVLFLLLSVSAMAGQNYLVKKGDTLSEISQEVYGTWRLWKKIAKVNNIANPQQLRAGNTIIIPDFSIKKKNQIRVHPLKIKTRKITTLQAVSKKRPVANSFPWHPGANPAQMSLERGLMGLGFSPDDALEIVDLIAKGKVYSWATVDNSGLVVDEFGNHYEMIRMGFGKGIFKDNPRPAWKDKTHLEAGRIYKYKGQYVFYPLICKNPTLLELISQPPPKKPAKPLTPPEPEKAFNSPRGPGAGFVYIPPKNNAHKFIIEHEPTVGGWYGRNQLAEWQGLYGEYMAWYRTGTYCRMNNGWSAGLGVYGYYSSGDSKISAYNWEESGFGPQVGLKYIYSDAWQWQAKVRLLWEDVSGQNGESGYSMNQEDLKLGLYTEYVDFSNLAYGSFWGITAEAWWMLKSSASINSTWSGDSPADRSQFGISVFYQKKLNEDWQARFTAGLFHQEWDDLTGVSLTAELRLWETIMFGPRLAFYPFGISDVYNDIATASDLVTWTGFIRAEFRKPIADWFCHREMAKVEKEDAVWLQETLRRLRAEQNQVAF